MSDTLSLSRGVKDAILRQQEQESAYIGRRRAMQDRLRASGIAEESSHLLLEALEGAWRPGFATVAVRHHMNAPARQIYEDAIRRGVSEQDFARLITSLTAHRAATDTLHRIETTALGELGPREFEKTVSEAETLSRMRGEVVEAARAVNPDIAVETAYRLAGEEGGSFDPLARTVTVALDYAGGVMEPRQALYRRMWADLEPLLTDKERGTLEQAFLASEMASKAPRMTADRLNDEVLEGRREWAADRFAEFMAPSRRRRMPRGLKAAFTGVGGFLDRVSNAAKGRGFVTAEDIWERVRSGELARRRRALVDKEALRLPDPRTSPTAYADMKAAIGRLSEQELAERIAVQEHTMSEAARRRSGLIRTLVTAPVLENRLTRRARRALNYFNGAYQDPVETENRDIRDRQRAMAALKGEQRERRDRAAGVTPSVPGGGIDGAPDPGGPQGPGPGGGPEDRTKAGAMARHMQSAMAVNDNGGADGLDITALRGTYHVKSRDGHEGPFYVVEMTPHGAQGRIGLASAANREAAASMMSAVDGIRPTGAASPAAEKIAAAARTLDDQGRKLEGVDLIRQSGLLDAELDDAISRRDLQALVFPLKTGDVVWHSPERGWQAGTLQGFLSDRLARGDVHASNARDALAGAVKVRGDDRRVWLDVPPAEEGEATLKGAHYDSVVGRWYAANDKEADKLAAWRMDGARNRTAEQRGMIAADVKVDPVGDDRPAVATGLDPSVLRDAVQASGVRGGEQAADLPAHLNPRAAAAYKVEDAKGPVVIVDLGRGGDVSAGSMPETAKAMIAAFKEQMAELGGDVILVTDREKSADVLTKTAHEAAGRSFAASAGKVEDAARGVAAALDGRAGRVVDLWREKDGAAAADFSEAMARAGAKTSLLQGLSDETVARTMTPAALQKAYQETRTALTRASSQTGGGPESAKAFSLAHRLTAYAGVLKERGVEVPGQHETKKKRPPARGQGR